MKNQMKGLDIVPSHHGLVYDLHPVKSQKLNPAIGIDSIYKDEKEVRSQLSLRFEKMLIDKPELRDIVNSAKNPDQIDLNQFGTKDEP